MERNAKVTPAGRGPDGASPLAPVHRRRSGKRENPTSAMRVGVCALAGHRHASRVARLSPSASARLSRACIGGPLVAYVDSLRPPWSIWNEPPGIASPSIASRSRGRPASCWQGACVVVAMSTLQTGRKQADTLDTLDTLELDPTDAALVAMDEVLRLVAMDEVLRLVAMDEVLRLVAADEARVALDAALAATVSAATDLVADCRLLLAVGTAWKPRGVDTI